MNISQLRRENSERAFAGCHICARAVSGRSAAQQTAAAERSAGGYAAFRALSAGGRLSYHNKKTHRIHTLYRVAGFPAPAGALVPELRTAPENARLKPGRSVAETRTRSMFWVYMIYADLVMAALSCW